MRKKIEIIVVSLFLFFTQINAVEIFGTSVDQATFPAQMLQLAEEAATAASMVTQVEKQISTLMSQTGVRDIIGFAQEMKKFHDFLTNYSLDLMALTDDIIDNPKSEIGKYAKQLFDKYQLFDNCNYSYMTTDMKRICKSRMVRQVQEIATYQEISKTLKKFGENIKVLADKRAKSTSIKESADIANAIQIEMAQMQVVKTQLDMMESQNRARERVDLLQFEQMQAEKRKNQEAYWHQDFLK